MDALLLYGVAAGAALLLFCAPLRAQQKSLIEDIEVQYNINSAINSMYNFDFDTAAKEYRWLEQSHSWHPLPSFLQGLNEWWKILPNLHVKTHDKAFLAHMEEAKERAKKLYKQKEWRAEGVVFLSLVHGLRARFYGERKQWITSLGALRKALKYLKEAQRNDYLHTETLIGSGLYNYYAEWLPENHKMARYFRFLFEKGDKKKGLEQLEKAAYNAFYTRIEARHFLASILDGASKHTEAVRLMSYLTGQYPNNGYFQREYANMLYKSKDFTRCQAVSEDMLQKVLSEQPGYGASQGRYAHFFLGQFYETSPLGLAAAVPHYEQVVGYAEEMDALSYSYTVAALLGLAEFYEQAGDRNRAKKKYREAKRFLQEEIQAPA